MKNDMQKEEKVNNKYQCPDCRSENIQWGGSCPVCMECGFSKCG